MEPVQAIDTFVENEARAPGVSVEHPCGGDAALSATLSSRCWIRVQIEAGRGFQDEATPSSPIPLLARLGLCWLFELRRGVVFSR